MAGKTAGGGGSDGGKGGGDAAANFCPGGTSLGNPFDEAEPGGEIGPSLLKLMGGRGVEPGFGSSDGKGKSTGSKSSSVAVFGASCGRGLGAAMSASAAASKAGYPSEQM